MDSPSELSFLVLVTNEKCCRAPKKKEAMNRYLVDINNTFSGPEERVCTLYICG